MMTWGDDERAVLKAMARAGWSAQMIAAQLGRAAYDCETMAEIMGLGRLSHVRPQNGERCTKCDRTADETCPYHHNFCERTAAV